MGTGCAEMNKLEQDLVGGNSQDTINYDFKKTALTSTWQMQLCNRRGVQQNKQQLRPAADRATCAVCLKHV